LKKEHRDTGENKTREGIPDLPGVSDLGTQRGKNHQRNGGRYSSEPESILVVLSLRRQKLSLGLGHLRHEAFEKFPFLDPSLHLLTKFSWDIHSTGASFFLPRQQSHLMERTFLSTPTARIATPFFGNTKGGLNEGLYLSQEL
jgi:hypothetical protein